MTLDDRLRRARDDYRRVTAVDGDGLGPPRPASPEGTGRVRGRLVLAAAAVALVVLVVAWAVGRDGRDRSESVDVVGPDTPTTTTEPARPVVVPDVTGFLFSVAEARAILAEAGLELSVHEADGDLPDAGVIAQEPPPGTEVVTGGAAGPAVVGVRTSLPPVPDEVDCPAMRPLRAVTDEGFDAMPPASGVGLDVVRRRVDEMAVHVSETGTLDAVAPAGAEIRGVYVGRGIVSAWEPGADGQPTTTPDVGFQVVVEVASVEDCPESPSFLDGTPLWFAVGWPSSAERSAREEEALGPHQPPGAVAVHDPTVRVEPAGQHTDGQGVILSVPAGYVQDWTNEAVRVCAVVGDDPQGPREVCDPEALVESGGAPSGPDAGKRLTLRQRVFTPTGHRDCAEPAVTCRLVVRASDGRYRASDRLAFTGEPDPPAASVTVEPGEAPGTFVVDPEGVEPHPSWLAMRADDPGRADGFPAFTVSVCAFGATRPDLAPYGEDLWGFGIVGEPLAPANCDTAPSPVELDPDAPDEPVTVTVGGLLHGYFGRSDCRVDECFVVIRQWAVDGYGGDGLLGHDVAIAAALLPFDAATAVPPPPSITIREPGPHRAGQTVTVEIAGLGEGRTTNIGVCHVDQPWSCGYPVSSFGVGNGTHRLTLPDSVAGCRPEQCYLELDSQGEGLPPLATTPLPIAP